MMLMILIVCVFGILVYDSIFNCGRLWCRKCVSIVCSVCCISSIGGSLRFC